LLAFLRLPLVCELMNLHASASMYPAISSADVLRLPIIVPPANDRARIVEKIRGSIEALAASQELTARTRADVEAFVLAGE
jgi:restriction endonuclease S subunit